MKSLKESINEAFSNINEARGDLSIKLKAPHDGTVLQHIIDNVKAINYHVTEVQPHIKSMEKWEAKEYVDGYKDTLAEYNENKSIILDNQSIFDTMLAEYDTNVVKFLAELDKFKK